MIDVVVGQQAGRTEASRHHFRINQNILNHWNWFDFFGETFRHCVDAGVCSYTELRQEIKK